MSTEHEVRVVRLGEIRKHDNADTLGIVEVDGRPAIVRLGEWSPGDLAIYVPVDSVCPTADPRFAFLARGGQAEFVRVRALRLRGVFSMGLLVPPDPGMAEGDEVSERLRITAYEPAMEIADAEAEPDPGFLPVYDIESVRKYHRAVLVEGEEVVLTEKIHGENGRFAWHRDRMWCASRTTFKWPGTSTWWAVADSIGLADRLRDGAPGIAIYGEVHGNTGGFPYGPRGHRLVAFDALDIEARRWLDYDEFCALMDKLGIERVPELYRGPWSPDLFGLAEGKSVLATLKGADHVREGWVLRPARERWHERLGRVLLKLHGEGFLTRG